MHTDRSERIAADGNIVRIGYGNIACIGNSSGNGSSIGIGSKRAVAADGVFAW